MAEPEDSGQHGDGDAVDRADRGFAGDHPAVPARRDLVGGQAADDHRQALGTGVAAYPGHEGHQGGEHDEAVEHIVELADRPNHRGGDHDVEGDPGQAGPHRVPDRAADVLGEPAPMAAAKSSTGFLLDRFDHGVVGHHPQQSPRLSSTTGIASRWYCWINSLTSSRSAVGTDRDRVGHHHLFQTDPGPVEDQVTERDHPLQGGRASPMT